MNELKHYGVKGMHWGVRRYQNYDGTRIGSSRNGGGSWGTNDKGSIIRKTVSKGTNDRPLGDKIKKRYDDLSRKKNKSENDQLRSKMDEWDKQRKRHNDLASQFWKDIDNGIDWDEARKRGEKRGKDFYVKKPFGSEQSKSEIARKDLEKFAKTMSVKDVEPELIKRAQKYELEFKNSNLSDRELKKLQKLVNKDNKGKIETTNRDLFYKKATEYANRKVSENNYTNSHYHKSTNDWFKYKEEYLNNNKKQYYNAVLKDYGIKDVELYDNKTINNVENVIRGMEYTEKFKRISK